MAGYLYSCADVERTNGGSAAIVAEVTWLDAERAEHARRGLVEPAEAGRLADLFRLLGDPTRVRLLSALAEAGELCVSDLAGVVGVPESSVSHALRLLRAAGVVRNRRDGRVVHYSLDDAHVRHLLELSLEHLRHGSDEP
jgi:DNA-binding transcriptional ArsR family regulator